MFRFQWTNFRPLLNKQTWRIQSVRTLWVPILFTIHFYFKIQLKTYWPVYLLYIYVKTPIGTFLLIYFQRDATLQSLFISGKLLYTFRVVSPPINRSTHNCIYSIWYLLTVIAIYLYCGRVGASFSVVWELYRSVLVRSLTQSSFTYRNK